MKQAQILLVDLRKIEGEGDFACPKCGVMLSPNDLSEENYTVIDVKSDDDDIMEEMTIQCLKCGAEIKLVGFSDLKENW